MMKHKLLYVGPIDLVSPVYVLTSLHAENPY